MVIQSAVELAMTEFGSAQVEARLFEVELQKQLPMYLGAYILDLCCTQAGLWLELFELWGILQTH